MISAWALVDSDWDLIGNKTGATRLGFGVMLKFYEMEGRFPAYAEEVPQVARGVRRRVLVKVDPALFAKYSWRGRTIEYHRAQIRKAYGTRPASEADEDRWAQWLADEVCPVEPRREQPTEAVPQRCKSERWPFAVVLTLVGVKGQHRTPAGPDRVSRRLLRELPDGGFGEAREIVRQFAGIGEPLKPFGDGPPPDLFTLGGVRAGGAVVGERARGVGAGGLTRKIEDAAHPDVDMRHDRVNGPAVAPPRPSSGGASRSPAGWGRPTPLAVGSVNTRYRAGR
ncbi:hypothetical protein GCM10009727_12870 [Actinomadura napierensis]|uniref:DUF4158 domain-containing protein n=1 Tax=Actinomadura napierensis TaxID=267854 RepID=A0ABP5K346_9ACTN